MRRWVLIGIAVVAAASVIALVAALVNDDEELKRVSPARSVGPTSNVSPSPMPSPDLTPLNSPSPTPSPSPSLNGPVLAAGGQRAATNLESRTGCSDDEPGKGFADLKWSPATQPGREQKIQVTIFRRGFEAGDFQTSEALAPERTTYRWTRPQGQAIHYWQVLTRHSDGWIPSETAKFEGPACVAD